MKHIIKFLALAIILQNSFCYGTMTTASITQDIITTNITTQANIYVISDMETYTTGGLTFTYPVGLFTLSPVVNISVQPNASHPATETFVAEISANSATSTTVMVYLVNGGIVSEAPNGSVLVSLLAIADPV
jgi:hypothetical protein